MRYPGFIGLKRGGYMKSVDFKLTSEDGKKIHVYSWGIEKNNNPRAVVQIAHGMAEHGKRYGDFAQALVNNGYMVYANDHRGHGKTAGTIEKLGYFADKNGWDLVVKDVYLLTQTIKSKHPDLPVFLFGHSMGSFLARDYISLFGKEIKGVILSGTSGDPGFLANIGTWLTKLECFLKGKKAKSPLMNKLSFGSLNNAFKPVRTDFDWLSQDNEEVDKYINDPFCGTVFTSGFFNDLLQGIKNIHKPDIIQAIEKDLPIYIFSGEKDPVGKNTKGVLEVVKEYQKAGIKDVTHKFYMNGRHEMLNELDREKVIKDVIQWLDDHI